MNEEGSITNSISTFAPPDEHTIENYNPIILTRQELDSIVQAAINARFDDIVNENAVLKEEIRHLAARLEDAELVLDAYSKRIRRLEDRLEMLESHNSLKQVSVADISTQNRIALVDKILTERKAVTFTELRKILKISKRSMNSLISQLDARKYSVVRHPNDRRQKILKKLR